MAHRSTLKSRQKAFKARHASKGSIKAANKGRIDKDDTAQGAGKPELGKHQRRNMKNQLRATKQSQLVERTKLFDGRHGVPRNVAIVPLTSDIDSAAVAQRLSSSLGCSQEGAGVVQVPKFRQKLRFFVPHFDKFFEVLDSARSADFVLFVLSANKEISDYGEQLMRCITLQGVTTSLGLIWGLDPGEKSAAGAHAGKSTRESLNSWFSHFFAAERLYSIDSDPELNMVGRFLCQRTPKGLHWRDERPYIVLNEAQVVGPNMVVEGFVRGQHLSPDCYMHIHTYGDFRIARIESVTNPALGEDVQTWEPEETRPVTELLPESEAISLENSSDDEDAYDEEDVADETVPRGVRVDGQKDVTQMIDAKTEDNAPQRAKDLPAGTSDYQAAWFIEGEDYRSDAEDEGALTDEEGELVDGSKAGDDEMMNDDAEADQPGGESDAESDAESEVSLEMDAEDLPSEARIEKDLATIAKDDLEFPDEIELDPHESGRERLKRYRGVHSIRHSDWNPLETDARMPAEFTRLYRPANLVATRNRIYKTLSQGAPVGMRVRVFLEGAMNPSTVADPMGAVSRGGSVTAYGLLPGEEKLGYVSASFAMDSEVTNPIKAKQQVLVQYGPRRMLINPLFSQDGHSDSNVRKLHRFLHPGRAAVATWIGPVVLSNAPVVYYRTEFKNEQVVLGAGTVQDSDANRVIVKTAILTGLPVKIHRKLVTIRHMFFSRADVEWFSQVPLYTKLGAQGYIKEALGTHGLFKATFDRKIRSEDTIALPLYKRVWPKLGSPALI